MANMVETKQYKLTSACPMLMHNIRLSDPTYELCRKLKSLTSKRKKTDDDFAEMARLEWHGGLYVDNDGRVILPGENIEATLVGGAKKNRLGNQFLSAVFVEKAAVLEYDGPKDIDKLWADKRFVNTTSVRIQKNRIFRTRPIFPEWSAVVDVSYYPSVIDVSQVTEALRLAGVLVGINDWRPKYGRFSVEEI